MGEEETIAVAETSGGPGGSRPPGEEVELPVVELLTGRGFVTGKSGAGKSILEGTPVYTENGRKPIEAVTEGERVLSLNKQTYRQEFREVQATIEHTDDRLLRITLEDGTELVGTEDHSFLRASDLEVVPVRGDELEEGMWMPLARELPSSGSVEEIDLGEYVGDANNVVVDGDVITSGPRTEDRRFPLTFEAGKEIGLFLAEGSFDSNMTVQITNVDDDIRAFLETRGYNLYTATCNKGFQPFATFLESEFGRGSAGKRLPGWVFDAPAQFRAGLLSGYFDGDGTVGQQGVTAMSKSGALSSGLAELLRQFGISTTIREKLTVYDGGERTYRRLSVDAFCTDRFRDVVDLSVPSKAAQLDELCDHLDEGDRFNSKDLIPNFGPVLNIAAREAGWNARDSDQRVDGASVHNLTRQQKAGRETYNRLVSELDIGGRARLFGESDIQWKRVASVEPLDEERTVYDLDVACNDNFIANGVFVHNSNSASVLVENLLDNEFGLLIVDIDGEYYGLKEEYEILHVGGDEECDIQVTTEHAEKLAGLALERNVPIILDVSSYLDESEAEALLTAVARSLFAKAKKQKQPFLLLVEEIHEYIPEQGSVGECGQMLIKIGKRGRKHGLGLCGISQRPADVKKDFITQCDWLLWHRLTWQNDTRVVRRILDGEYADAVENLDDGEGFLVTDWTDEVRRVQFYRKETFDAGATPGLEDVERPPLKSVSEDLVSELETIRDEASAREDRIAELEAELEQKEHRIEELERELREARNLRELATQFVEALTGHPGVTGRTDRPPGGTVVDGSDRDSVEWDSEWPGGWRESVDGGSGRNVEGTDGETDPRDGEPHGGGAFGTDSQGGDEPREDEAVETDNPRGDEPRGDEGDRRDDAGEGSFSAARVLSKLRGAPDRAPDPTGGRTTREEVELELYADAELVDGRAEAGDSPPGRGSEADPPEDESGTDEVETESENGTAESDPPERESESNRPADDGHDAGDTDVDPDAGSARLPDEEPLVVRELKAEIAGLETRTRRMLAAYREEGPMSAQNAYFVAGGDGDRTRAYARNRTLRVRGLVDHVGRGRYDYRLRERLAEELGDHDETVVETYAAEIEEASLDAD